MSNFKISNVSITGIVSVVPNLVIHNLDDSIFQDQTEAQRFIDNIGVETRRVVGQSGICTSDMCIQAAEHIFESLDWNKDEVDLLVFVSQTPDYVLPATSCIIQNKLGLGRNTYAIDISLGCSGWVYGLSVIASLMQTGVFKKGILLAGDTTSMTKSPKDKSTFPLFGDCGTATALEYTPNEGDFYFNVGTDGSGFENIMIRDGGYRNPVSIDSFTENSYGEGIIRNNLQSILNGANVFAFGISRAPKSVNELLTFMGKNTNEIDVFLFHQANKMMNEKIRTKLKIEEEKVPYSLNEFGNTSSASIPLTLCKFGDNLENVINKRMIACGFGVGLSWGSVYFATNKLKISKIKNFQS